MYILGKQETCYFAEEVLQTYRPNEAVEYCHESYHIEDMLPALMEAPRDTIMLETGAFHDEFRVMGTAARKIMLSNPRAMLIVFAEGHNRSTALVEELIEMGVKWFVFGMSLGDQRAQLSDILAGKAAPLLPLEKEEVTLGDEPEEEVLPGQPAKIKIAVVGSSPRIGTSTHALQIVRFLLLQGKRVCYIEKNHSQFAVQVLNYYDEEEIHANEEDKAMGRYRCSNVDIFHKQEMILRALALDYEYYVFDYGCVHDTNFDVMNFLERDLKILVCGYKPNESADLQRVLTQNILIENDSLQYLFNFVSKSDIPDLEQMMDKRANKSTFYGYYTPDNFVYDDPDGEKDALYRRLLNYSDAPLVQPEKKKFTLFGKRR